MRRIFWFSPLPPARTDVANYTLRLAQPLQRQAEVVFCFPGDTPPNITLPARRARSLRAAELNGADLCIYHLGNNAQFHAEIWDCAERHPGLVVLHDRALHECYLGRRAGSDSARYLREMAGWYGEAGYQTARAVRAGLCRPADQATAYPLYEAALVQALAVVTHNSEVARELRQRFPLLPVLDLPLPFPRPPEIPVTRRGSDKVIRLIAFGFMSRNRRLVEFLVAWADSPWRESFVLDLVGELQDAERVEQTLQQTGLHERVNRHGFVSDAELDMLLARSDLALNLRNPTMGEASGTQLRIWANRLPSVVSDIGWYSRLPDDCVLKVDTAREQAELQVLLARLAQREIDLRALGEAGWERLGEHDPVRYVEALLAWLGRERWQWSRLWWARRQIETLARHRADLLPADAPLTLPAVLTQL
jgi:hypothetical protein